MVLGSYSAHFQRVGAVLSGGADRRALGVACAVIALSAADAWADEVPPASAATSITTTLATKSSEGASSAITLPTIDVNAAANGDGAVNPANQPTTVGLKLPMTLKETPSTITVIPREQIEAQNLTTLRDAMERTPGVVVEPIDGNRINLYARGFEITNLQFDGVATQMDDRIFSVPELAMFDRVEVMKGPAGLMNGFGGPGGTVNLVRKRPGRTFQADGQVSYGSWNDRRTEADVGGALNESGTLRARGVGVFQDKDFFYDNAEETRSLLYGTLEGDITPDDTVSVAVFSQRVEHHGPWTLPAEASINNGVVTLNTLDVSRSTGLAPKWNTDVYTITGVMADGVHRFANGWKVKLAGQYFDNALDRRMAYAYAPVYAGVGTTTLYALKLRYDQQQGGLDLMAGGPFALFGREHEAVVGASYERTEFRHRTWPASPSYVQVVNVYNPVISEVEPNWGAMSRDVTTETDNYGLYGVLRFSLMDRLHLIMGGRATWWRSTVDYTLPATASDTKESETGKVTPYAGLVYDVTPSTAIYASVSDIFEPQSYTDAAGEILEPLQGRQYEAGVKTDLMGGALHASAAVFTLREENRPVGDPAYPGQSVYLSQGEARSDGFELELAGRVARGLDVYAGYTYTYARALDDSESAASDFTGIAPKHMIKLWGTYRLPEEVDDRLSLGVGFRAQSGMYYEYASLGNARLTQGGYAVTDARVAYDVTENVTAALNVNNIFDRTYWERVSSPQSGNIYGQPRSFMVTLKAKL